MEEAEVSRVLPEEVPERARQTGTPREMGESMRG